MRKILVLAAGALALTLPLAAQSAELSNGAGQTCAHGGTWHFINNQTTGIQTPGTLKATFSGGQVIAVADKVVNKTQHWTIDATGKLLDAETNLPGRLVLSDFSCDGGKKG